MIVWRGHSCPRQRSVQNLARELADNGVHPSPSENPCPWNIAGVYPITKRRTGPVTFCRLSKQPFSEEECSLILKRCLQGNGSKFHLHAAVVMPEHVHLLLTPGEDANGWPCELHEIMRLIKGASARDVNRVNTQGGPVWQDESFDYVLRSEEYLQEKP